MGRCPYTPHTHTHSCLLKSNLAHFCYCRKAITSWWLNLHEDVFAKSMISYSASILTIQNSGYFPHQLSACSADPAGVFYSLMLDQNVRVSTGWHKQLEYKELICFYYLAICGIPKATLGQRCSVRCGTLILSPCQRITGLSRVIPICKVTWVIYSPSYQSSTFNPSLPRNTFQNLLSSVICSVSDILLPWWIRMLKTPNQIDHIDVYLTFF